MTDVTIYPSDDSWVNQSSSGSNYGSNNTMQLANQSGYLEYMYLKFSLATIPAGVNIDSATLYLYMTADSRTGTSGTAGTYVISADWAEGTITYSNKPADSGSDILAWTFNAVGSYSGDLTDEVKNWYSGAVNNYGVAIKITSATAEGYWAFATSEAASNKPYLVVTYSSPFIPKIIIF